MEQVWERFREPTGTEPSGKTTILGESLCSADEMAAFAARRGQRVDADTAALYLRLGWRYGIRGDAAFCQALYETRSLAAGRVRPIGETRITDLWGLQGREGLFDEPFVEQQMQLLFGFAVAEPPLSNLDMSLWTPRLQMIRRKQWRGIAPHWEDLNGKWSVPGTNYGQDITAIWRNMVEWALVRRRRAARTNAADDASGPAAEAVSV
ncbi:hypothetical protein COLU111180_14055 [Cohnella lubricantis]|uniref:Mannosyl-glycoprotein endo-beta-N-acetylglucosamidase-like domain-containing protein n=1 Tax=Cohnella lubricantis TaxID=2163172 RepID=A0A841T9V1_9BACL|nr:hypothetical protein [Cohnella lubricantis]MBB6676805.1 hypothetical protein [Cohnella lubricantis]MBP2118107.1 hypothetical protein [Cohnella lubricantis]